MDLVSVVLITIYAGISLIPIIYNHNYVENTRNKYHDNTAKNKEEATTASHQRMFLGKSLVILLNNLDDREIESILRKINKKNNQASPT